MKNLFYIVLSLSVLGCVQPKSEISSAFFKNSDFIQIYDADTTHLSFLDTTYSLLTKNGIQHNSRWSIKRIGEEKLLILGKHFSRVFQVISFNDTSCTLKVISQTEEPPFVLLKASKNDIKVQGLWKSSKIPPPPDYSLNNPEKWDSILNNRALWESETFEITEDSIIYSFYDYRTSVKFEKPFIQLENDLSVSIGKLNVLRPIAKNDSTLTLEFYFADANQSPVREYKKSRRKLKRVANNK